MHKIHKDKKLCVGIKRKDGEGGVTNGDRRIQEEMAKSVNGTPGEKGKANECTFGKAELEDRRVRFILRY